jgi:hypothetical protein
MALINRNRHNRLRRDLAGGCICSRHSYVVATGRCAQVAATTSTAGAATAANCAGHYDHSDAAEQEAPGTATCGDAEQEESGQHGSAPGQPVQWKYESGASRGRCVHSQCRHCRRCSGNGH